MKHNVFLAAALEELNKEVATGDQTTITTTTAVPAASEATPVVTEVNIDQSVDAVAALMAKNASLQDQNASLEAESFDSDLDIVDTASDSVQKDLAEAVSACEALEELAHIATLAVKTKQTNAAGVASLMFGLEQICLRAGLESPVAALEDNAIALYNPETGKEAGASSEEVAEAQTGAVAKSAMDKAKEIGKKLIEGIKRIVGWILNIMRQFFTRVGGLPDRISKAAAEYDQIDESKTIDSVPFIASLRLVEGGGDANKQFEEYALLATKTLYGFFGDSFVMHMAEVCDHLHETTEDKDEEEVGIKKLNEVLRTALGVIYTESGSGADIPDLTASIKESELTIGKTVPCIGGVQLYLAATMEGERMYCRSGLVKTPPKFDAPASIPVVNKHLADKMFGAINKWLNEQENLEKKLKLLLEIRQDTNHDFHARAVSRYLSVLSAIATNAMPQLLRMNIQNSINFVAYVEKSIAVSKAAPAEAK